MKCKDCIEHKGMFCPRTISTPYGKAVLDDEEPCAVFRQRSTGANEPTVDSLRARIAVLEDEHGVCAAACESERKVYIAARDLATAERDDLRAENKRLREALRHHAMRRQYSMIGEPYTACSECNLAWRVGSPENHAPGCLAAPDGEGK